MLFRAAVLALYSAQLATANKPIDANSFKAFLKADINLDDAKVWQKDCPYTWIVLCDTKHVNEKHATFQKFVDDISSFRRHLFLHNSMKGDQSAAWLDEEFVTAFIVCDIFWGCFEEKVRWKF